MQGEVGSAVAAPTKTDGDVGVEPNTGPHLSKATRILVLGVILLTEMVVNILAGEDELDILCTWGGLRTCASLGPSVGRCPWILGDGLLDLRRIDMNGCPRLWCFLFHYSIDGALLPGVRGACLRRVVLPRGHGLRMYVAYADATVPHGPSHHLQSLTFKVCH